MAYTNVWSKAAPLGSQAANLLDDDIRALKLDISERFTTLFGTADLDGIDPVIAPFLKLQGSITSKIIPGATSLSLRNNADNADNLLVTDAGQVTVRNNLIVSSILYVQDQLVFLSASLNKIVNGSVANGMAFRNNADSASNITISDAGVVTIRAGLTITTGGITVTGTVNVTGDENLTGNLVVARTGVDTILAIRADAGKSKIVQFATGASNRWQMSSNNTAEGGANVGSDFALNRYDDAGTLIDTIFVITRSTGLISLNKNILAGGFLSFSTAAAKIIGGPTSLTLRNNADNADNILITDAGNVTIRGNFVVSGTFAPVGLTSTGTITVNITSGTTFVSNSTTNAVGDSTQFIFQRGATNKWRIGVNINGTNTDEFNIYNDAGALTAIRIANTTGAVHIPVSLQVNGGAIITKILSNTVTWDPPSTGAGAFTSTTVTVTGAAVGDPVFFANVWMADSAEALTMSAYVSSADTVTVQFKNTSAGNVDLTSRTTRVFVFHV